MKYALTNCDIFTGTDVLIEHAVIIDGPIIHSITTTDKIPKDIKQINLNGKNIAPGFIDLQVNGGGDTLFSDNPSKLGIERILSAHKKFGTTSILPTLITSSDKSIHKAIEAIRPYQAANSSTVLGLHLEGPFINPKKSGIHNKQLIRKPSDNDRQLIINESKIIKIVTIAPECTSSTFISDLTSAGVAILIGHTEATYQQAKEAIKSGAIGATHLFNAMTQFEGRNPGAIGAIFDTNECWASIIADGFHTEFESLRIAKKIKGNRIFLVTDAMPTVGGSRQDFLLDDQKIGVKNGKCTNNDGTLAGSALDMASAVRNLVQKVGIPLPEALRMASLYPAQLIRTSSYLGKIAAGYRANLIVFNNQIIIEKTIINGEIEETK
jgi:N-acetylglucosamine-6-phosphate deacetylase